MAHTHEFDCRVCGAHLDSQKQLDEHNQKEHGRQANSSSSSSFRGTQSGGSTGSTGSGGSSNH